MLYEVLPSGTVLCEVLLSGTGLCEVLLSDSALCAVLLSGTVLCEVPLSDKALRNLSGAKGLSKKILLCPIIPTINHPASVIFQEI